MSLVVDLHADTASLMMTGYDLSVRHEPPLPSSSWVFHLDLPRARQGGLDAQFFGLISPPWRWMRPARFVDWQLDALERAARRWPDRMTLSTTAAQVRAARRDGKLAALRGIEGAHALQGDLGQVARFAARGVVYLGLLHFHQNDAGRPAHGRGEDPHEGLTAFGKDLVDELCRLHVIVDLAHINRKGFFEAVERASAPVIVSHTTILSAHRHWRGIDDAQIRAVASTGGCIGVMFAREYLGGRTLDAVCDHLLHLLNVGGEDVAALGSDFDGWITPVDGLSDVTGLPDLIQALAAKGLPERVLQKLLGDNALRVLADVRGS